MEKQPETVQAAGVILYRLHDEVPSYLLLRNARHGTWGFPKGHIESDESAREGAIRECAEETGILPTRLDPDFCKRTVHHVRSRTSGKRARKETDYFLAPVDDERVRISSEHDERVWEHRLNARRRLQFDILRELLDCAHNAVLRRHGLGRRELRRARNLLAARSRPEDLWRVHSLEVAAVARRIGDALLDRAPHLPLDPETLEASALLHDLGRSVNHGMDHPRLGMKILAEEGLEHLAKTCLSHWLKGRKREDLEGHPYFTAERLAELFDAFDLERVTLLEKIVSIADALVRQDTPVRLEERLSRRPGAIRRLPVDPGQ